ncbi:MAG: hypothetical protein KME46_32780 [Brasilonema angustatum HA4187-MV1]|nr:hypothetical protein [Brasilonema angustatum HA4187-MV1]
MGEAKRRRTLGCSMPQHQQPNNFLVTSHGVLGIYRDTRTHLDFIDPLFKVEGFDLSKPHTFLEWQNYFFSTNPESFVADNLKFSDDVITNSIKVNNLHCGAFYIYLNKKEAKGLVLDMENTKIEKYLNYQVTQAEYLKPIKHL